MIHPIRPVWIAVVFLLRQTGGFILLYKAGFSLTQNLVRFAMFRPHTCLSLCAFAVLRAIDLGRSGACLYVYRWRRT